MHFKIDTGILLRVSINIVMFILEIHENQNCDPGLNFYTFGTHTLRSAVYIIRLTVEGFECRRCA